MEKRQQMMELWRRNFQDSEEFIQFYFNKKYSDEDSLVYEENGKALSGLLMLPYPITWKGATLTTSYISGACTLTKARNRGLMTLLLKEAFQEMYKRGIALSTLIPAEEWLIKYYGNLGYTTVFSYSTEKQEIKTDPPVRGIQINCPEKYDSDFARGIFPYFEQKMQSRDCCIQHPIHDYLAIVEEAYLTGGRLAAIFSSGSGIPTGWALAFPEDGMIKVKEIFANTPTEKITLLHYFAQLWQISSLECRTLPEESQYQRYGMARITDVFQMLQHIARQQPEITISIKVNDPHLPQNDGVYLLSGGICEKQEIQEIQTDIETDIPILTQALLGYHPNRLPEPLASLFQNMQPYMNLMLD